MPHCPSHSQILEQPPRNDPSYLSTVETMGQAFQSQSRPLISLMPLLLSTPLSTELANTSTLQPWYKSQIQSPKNYPSLLPPVRTERSARQLDSCSLGPPHPAPTGSVEKQRRAVKGRTTLLTCGNPRRASLGHLPHAWEISAKRTSVSPLQRKFQLSLIQATLL